MKEIIELLYPQYIYINKPIFSNIANIDIKCKIII